MRHPMLLAALALTGAASPEPAPLPAWLAGSWCTEAGPSRTCEHWSPPAGGMMLGTSQTVRDGRTRSFEYMRIVADGDAIAFIAQPNGAAPVTFPAIAANDQSVAFANAANDYPQGIRYWREGEVLNAEITLADGGNAMRWRYLRAD